MHMALDHFVSQVYLRKFLAPELGNRMYAMRKSDLATFTPRTRDVCRTKDGNTNRYLVDEPIIEHFLMDVEPRFNESVEIFAEDVPLPEHIYSVAGIISYFLTCSPAALRVNSEPIRAMLVEAARAINQEDEPAQLPEEIGEGNLADLLEDGRVELQIDPRYPGAIGIANIASRVSKFGNSKWDILLNGNQGCEFFTSDYPVAIQQTPDPRVLARIVPLTPNIAVRIIPDLAQRDAPLDFDFPNFRYRKIDIDAGEARSINRLLVRCAEDVVFASDWRDWRSNFVERHRNYRVDTVTQRLPFRDGAVIHNRSEIVPHDYRNI